MINIVALVANEATVQFATSPERPSSPVPPHARLDRLTHSAPELARSASSLLGDAPVDRSSLQEPEPVGSLSSMSLIDFVQHVCMGCHYRHAGHVLGVHYTANRNLCC
jgi:hypothetical protein